MTAGEVLLFMTHCHNMNSKQEQDGLRDPFLTAVLAQICDSCYAHVKDGLIQVNISFEGWQYFTYEDIASEHICITEGLESTCF